VLQWAKSNGCLCDGYTYSRAAGGGQLTVLKWLREQGCPWDAKTCSAAAYGGHLEILQWARACVSEPLDLDQLKSMFCMCNSRVEDRKWHYNELNERFLSAIVHGRVAGQGFVAMGY
jgi:hypothetical protein